MRSPRSRSTVLLLAILAAAPLPAQEELDLQAVARELAAIFERPAGTTIPPEAQDRFRAFLVKYDGQDLGPLSYASALYKYLTRDYRGAAEDLDAFFVRFQAIEDPEHSMMAGRVYLNAVSEEAKRRTQDTAKVNRWAESLAALYPDTRVLALYLGRLLDDEAIADPVGFRVAVCKGLMRSRVSARAKDNLLRAIYSRRE